MTTKTPAPADRREIWLMAGIFLGAFLLRLIYMIFARQHYFFYESPSADVTYYQEWARDIARGNWLGDRTFLGLPLYPYFLSVLIRLTVNHLEAVRVLHLLLGSLNCILIYLVGQKIFSKKIGILAAILAATNFILIYYDWLMMPVPLLIFLTLIILLALLHRDELQTWREWFFLGLFIGLAILGDGKFLFFFLILLGYEYFVWKKASGHLPKLTRQMLPLILGATLVLGASAVRGKMISGEWIFISTQGGLSLYAGNNPEAQGTYEHPSFLRPDHFGQDEDQRIVA